MAYAKDIKGQVFGRLTAVSYLTDGKWLCKCECGNEKIVRGNKLRNGNTQSCGCKRREVIKERNLTHNLTNDPLYSTWLGIKTRCFNTNHNKYFRYGGRNITMYSEWVNDFVSFRTYIKETLGDRPPGLTLDRIDNDSHYQPGNLRWADYVTQNNNRGDFNVG